MKICEAQCNQCLFTTARIVSMSRMRSILKTCARNQTFFVCHKSKPNDEIMCRGHYNAVDNGKLPPPQMLRIAERLRCVEFVAVPQ